MTLTGLPNVGPKLAENLRRVGLETPEDYDRRYKMHYLCAEWLEELLSLLDEGEQYEAVKAVLSAQKE